MSTKEIQEDKKLREVIDKIFYIVDYHNIKTANGIRKFILTRNYNEEDIKLFKDVFEKYDELNIYNLCLFYKKNLIKNMEELINKIKGK